MQNNFSQIIENPKENLKIKYKNERLQEAKQIYLCECSKIYLSFPALYLHVRNKHKIKLTTKITDKICKMEQKNGKTYITYFLIPQQQFEEKKDDFQNSEEAKKSSKNEALGTSDASIQDRYLWNSENKNIQKNGITQKNFNIKNSSEVHMIIEDYLRHKTFENGFFDKKSAVILSHFLNYMKKYGLNSAQFDQFSKQSCDSMVFSLPLFFNEFLLYYLPLSNIQQEQVHIDIGAQIQIMKKFGDWLRQRNYTNLIIYESI